MNLKSKIIAEINKKAQKIRDKRVEAANNKTLENAIFDFFRNIEESRLIHNGTKYDSVLFDQARRTLESRVKNFDVGAKISVEFNAPQDPTSWEEQLVRGITVWWGQAYIKKNNVEPSTYVDVSQMLLI